MRYKRIAKRDDGAYHVIGMSNRSVCGVENGTGSKFREFDFLPSGARVCQTCASMLDVGQKKQGPLMMSESYKEWVRSNDFLASYEWRKLRMEAILEYGTVCMCCRSETNPIHVDHIKPRKKYPELALDFDNLQVLCSACNHGKGNWDETDWRPAVEEMPEECARHMRDLRGDIH